MIKSFLNLLLIGGILTGLPFIGSVSAEEPAEETEQVEAPVAEESEAKEESEVKEEFRKGVIASNISTTRQGVAVNAVSSTSAAGDDGLGPIGGSVSKIKRGRCSAVVVNKSPVNSYSVSYAVEGVDNSGRRVFRNTYTSRLSSGQSATKEFSCNDGLSFQVVITGGRKL